jgi:hypothetical protein
MIEMETLNLHGLLVTDNKGTYLLENKEEQLILFKKKENAEMLACQIANNYYLVQVIPVGDNDDVGVLSI